MTATGPDAPRRKINWGTLALIVVLHVAAIFGLARAFAPDFTQAAIEQATSLVTVTVRTREPPPPAPEPAPEPPSPVPDPGAAGEAGAEAKPREVAAPRPEIPIAKPSPVPPVASTGTQNASGAAEEGAGTGAGGEGAGTGSGAGGTGAGGGGGISRGLEKIAGDISDARDYPRRGRDERKGHDVIIELTVGTDGRVSACRVTDPSPDPEADAITCRLATERFRFRPALDAAGNPVVGRFLWRQQWF